MENNSTNPEVNETHSSANVNNKPGEKKLRRPKKVEAPGCFPKYFDPVIMFFYSFFKNCFSGALLFSVQTGVLLLKNFFSLIFHPLNTCIRLLIPIFVIIGLIILNITSMENEKKTVAEGSDSSTPRLIETPRLPNYNGEITMAWGPCVHGNRTVEKNNRITSKFYEIMKVVAANNDRGVGPYGEKSEKLTIAPLSDCYTTASELMDCKYSICPVFDTRIMKASLLPGMKKRIHGGLMFYFGDEPTMTALRQLNNNDLFPDVQMTTRLHYTVYYNSTAISGNPFFPVVRYTPFDYSTSIMRGVDEAIFENQKNVLNVDLGAAANIKTYRKPFPANQGENVEQDKLMMLIGPLFLFVSLYIVNINIHYSINQERDLKLREAMRMMGLSNFAYWASWFITESVVNFIVCVGIVATGWLGGLLFFRNANVITVFLILFIMGESIIALFMALSCIVKSNTMTNISSFFFLLICICFLFFFIDLLGLLRNTSNIPLAVSAYNLPILNFLNVFPPFNFGKACYDVSLTVKQTLNGTQWVSARNYGFSDFFNTDIYKDYPQVQGVPSTIWNVAFMGLSVPFFLILCWYLDNVIPDSYGRARNWFFCLTPSFWGVCTNSRDNLAVDFSLHNAKFHSILPDTDSDIFEEYQRVIKAVEEDTDQEIPVERQKYPVKVIKLSKTYKGGLFTSAAASKNALDNLTLCTELNSVLVLLGHNGSGKSTTVNALVGLQRPSAGDAIVFGYSAVNNSQSVQQIIGVCFQHDIIFPELSGMMHMILFATLKGIPATRQYSEIKEKLNDVMLWTFRNQTASTYSGGMKRRLMVAIAMLGDPRIVFLDEPTSGMDPSVKRSIWDLIARYKKNRVIILTTHSMEEAEAIGDKIAILALGRLRAVGSSLHLKNRFGAGYGVSFCSDEKSVSQLKNTIAKISPNSRLVQEASGTVNYTLPVDLGSEEVLKLFQFLESQTAKAKKKFQTQYEENRKAHDVAKNSTRKSKRTRKVVKNKQQDTPQKENTKKIQETKKDSENEENDQENLGNEISEDEEEEEEKILVQNWLLSHTTLEEVFLRLTHGKGSEGGVSNDDILKKMLTGEGKGTQLNVKLERDFSEKKRKSKKRGSSNPNEELDEEAQDSLNQKGVTDDDEIAIGYVVITEKNTLEHVRDFIIEQGMLPRRKNLPQSLFGQKSVKSLSPMLEYESFLFVMPGEVPISRSQEKTLRAMEYLPSITIRIVRDEEAENMISQLSSPQFENSPQNEKILQEYIQKIESDNARLKRELEEKLTRVTDSNFGIENRLHEQEYTVANEQNEKIQELIEDNSRLRNDLESIKLEKINSLLSINEETQNQRQNDMESIQNLLAQNQGLRDELELMQMKSNSSEEMISKQKEIENLKEQIQKTENEKLFERLRLENDKLRSELDSERITKMQILEEKDQISNAQKIEFENFSRIVQENEKLKKELQNLQGGIPLTAQADDETPQKLSILQTENEKLKNQLENLQKNIENSTTPGKEEEKEVLKIENQKQQKEIEELRAKLHEENEKMKIELENYRKEQEAQLQGFELSKKQKEELLMLEKQQLTLEIEDLKSRLQVENENLKKELKNARIEKSNVIIQQNEQFTKQRAMENELRQKLLTENENLRKDIDKSKAEKHNLLQKISTMQDEQIRLNLQQNSEHKIAKEERENLNKENENLKILLEKSKIENEKLLNLKLIQSKEDQEEISILKMQFDTKKQNLISENEDLKNKIENLKNFGNQNEKLVSFENENQNLRSEIERIKKEFSSLIEKSKEETEKDNYKDIVELML